MKQTILLRSRHTLVHRLERLSPNWEDLGSNPVDPTVKQIRKQKEKILLNAPFRENAVVCNFLAISLFRNKTINYNHKLFIFAVRQQKAATF